METIPFELISACRICGSPDLLASISLGNLASCGTFPNSPDIDVAYGELNLKVCGSCSLVQLDRNFDLKVLFGEEYGYRSSLNSSMRWHLESLIRDSLLEIGATQTVDSLLDIGSNDGTLLNYVKRNHPNIGRVIGIDPTLEAFKDDYLEGIIKIKDFFSIESLKSALGLPTPTFSIITSVAMLYDLPNPNKFVKDISQVLAEDGTWIFELTVLDTILENAAIDSICHEHFEYYSFRSIEKLLAQNDMAIWRWERNDSNGGSLRIFARHAQCLSASTSVQSSSLPNSATLTPREVVTQLRAALQHADEQIALAKAFLINAEKDGKVVYGLGASTKGNAYLQYAGIGPELLPTIAEVNEDKFGCWTPGTRIPIEDESHILPLAPSALLVFPWHFRDNFVNRYADYLNHEGKLIFPLPNFEIVEK